MEADPLVTRLRGYAGFIDHARELGDPLPLRVLFPLEKILREAADEIERFQPPADERGCIRHFRWDGPK